MVEISDVLVTPYDEEVLDRYSFDWNRVDQVMFDIVDLILEDPSGFELQNQIDDAENFKMAGEAYYQRVNFILGTCRSLWDEQLIRKAVKEFFTVQNNPAGVLSDGNGNYDPDQLEEYIARMTKAVMTNERISRVCATIFEYYMSKKLWNQPSYDKTLRMTRMKLVRGRKLDNDFNHVTVELNVPELDTEKTSVHDENGKLLEIDLDTRTDKDDPTTQRWMNCEEDEKELDKAMYDWLHTKFY